jgi:hypothetical protein
MLEYLKSYIRCYKLRRSIKKLKRMATTMWPWEHYGSLTDVSWTSWTTQTVQGTTGWWGWVWINQMYASTTLSWPWIGYEQLANQVYWYDSNMNPVPLKHTKKQKQVSWLKYLVGDIDSKELSNIIKN